MKAINSHYFRNVFYVFLLLVTTTMLHPMMGQDIGFTTLPMQDLASTAPHARNDIDEIISDPWVTEAARLNIPIANYTEIKGLQKGYYPVIAILSTPKGSSKLLRRLKRNGMEPVSFFHPDDENLYICAGRYTTGLEAISATEDIVRDGKNLIVEILTVEESSISKSALAPNMGEVSNSIDFDPASPLVSTKSAPAPNKIIKKANQYFDQMWYADAAALYEEGLERNPEFASPEVVQNLADAHYFTSDMERANYWYEKLYQMEEENLSTENLFKYSQALRGSGNYGRARRILRLYDKKLESSPIGRYRRDELVERQATLDRILDSEDLFAVKNLKLNSEYSEFAPAFYEADQVVYASSMDSAFLNTRRYKWNDQPYLDLYVAKMNEGSEELNAPIKFSKSINTKYHEAAVAFSPDHQTMYFTRNNFGKKLRRDKLGVNHLKLYRSRKIDGEWTVAEELPFNGEDFSTGHPAVSPDGKQLFFVSDRPGSMGETDIFSVDINEDGSFSVPRNLGTNINTEQKEMFPFFTGNRLYFSSDGHTGIGGLDVFQADYDEEEGFQEVKNMGKPINSSKDDFSFIVSEETQKGYFASNREGGKGDDDLYAFERLIPEEVNENAIAGVIMDKISGETLPDAMVELLDENNILLKEVISQADGSFVFEDLESNTKYHLRIKKDTYAEKDQFLQTLENEMVSTEVPMSKLEELVTIEAGVKKLKTEMIYFDFDKSTIRDDAAEELDKLVSVMQEYPSMVIKIASHTDSRGPKAYNLKLSDRRAKSTRDYLISQGIDAERIESATGYGESQLLNECDGSVRCAGEKHKRNRRSEFIIVNM